MANYPIKMLKDEQGNPFVPLVSTEGIQSPDHKTLADMLEDKLEVDNIIPGDNVTITTDGNDITISTSGKGVLIDDLNTATAGEGGLDAHQGKVLKEMIPEIINDVTSTSTTAALSANQGYILNQKVVPVGGTAGQVLKKRTDSNYSLEWGDAADPNAVVGDGSIKKIVEITYEDYKALEDAGEIDEDTEYHILDSLSVIDNLQETLDSLQSQITTLKNSLKPVATSGKYTDLDGEPSVINNLTSTSTTDALSAAQGKVLKDTIDVFNTKVFTTQGYQKLPSGLIIQWTQGSITWDSAAQHRVDVAFPTPFPNACLGIAVTPQDTGRGQDKMFYSLGASSFTAASVNILGKTTGSYFAIDTSFYIIAIGY